MRTRRYQSHVANIRASLAIPVAMGLVFTTLLASGCGQSDSLVGGACAAGYARCGNSCCAVPDDAAGETGQEDGDGGSGGALYDAVYGDGASRIHGDSGQEASADAGIDSSMDSGIARDTGSGADTGSIADTGPAPIDAALEAGSGQPDAIASDDGSAEGGSSDDGSAPAEAGPVCSPPDKVCSGRCIDVTSDPNNCGDCNIVCPSQICQSSHCVGSTTGGIVFIGHDYSVNPAPTGPAAVLSNAVFMARSNPLHVMVYERYAMSTAITSVNAVLSSTATQVGRNLSVTHTSTDSDIPSKLSPTSYDVLLVHDQTTAAAGAMATLGAGWATTLATFTQQYGIVVVLDGGTGRGEMPQFASSTGLLQVTAQTAASTGTALDVLAPADAVGVGVLSPYAASANSVFLTTEANVGNVIYVVGGASSQGPVVVHKVL